MLLRLALLLGPASMSALAWLGVAWALGLPLAVRVAAAIAGGAGACLALAVCAQQRDEPARREERESPAAAAIASHDRWTHAGRDERIRTEAAGRRVVAGAWFPPTDRGGERM